MLFVWGRVDRKFDISSGRRLLTDKSDFETLTVDGLVGESLAYQTSFAKYKVVLMIVGRQQINSI